MKPLTGVCLCLVLFRAVGFAQKTVRRGYELNDKLTFIQTENHEGQLAAEHSFAQVQPANLVLTAMKQAEDGSSLVLRFYEWEGKEGDTQLTLPSGVQSASETDLMERAIAPLSVRNGVIRVHTRPYEIKTVKVQFAFESRTETSGSLALNMRRWQARTKP